MTRKDYVAVAEKIRARAEEYTYVPDLIIEFANDIADVFKADNPRFDRGRFLSACGIN